jgi:hypothetical protein
MVSYDTMEKCKCHCENSDTYRYDDFNKNEEIYYYENRKKKRF